jgi:hypothetical protein
MSDFATGEQISESDKDTIFIEAVKDTYKNLRMLVCILEQISSDLQNSDIKIEDSFPPLEEATALLNRLKTHIPNDMTTDKIKSIKMSKYDHSVYEETLKTIRNNTWCENRYRTRLHTTPCENERHAECGLRDLLTNVNWQREIERLIKRNSEIVRLLSDIYIYGM